MFCFFFLFSIMPYPTMFGAILILTPHISLWAFGWILGLWETVDFPLDPQTAQLFCRGVNSSKDLGCPPNYVVILGQANCEAAPRGPGFINPRSALGVLCLESLIRARRLGQDLISSAGLKEAWVEPGSPDLGALGKQWPFSFSWTATQPHTKAAIEGWR